MTDWSYKHDWLTVAGLTKMTAQGLTLALNALVPPTLGIGQRVLETWTGQIQPHWENNIYISFHSEWDMIFQMENQFGSKTVTTIIIISHSLWKEMEI